MKTLKTETFSVEVPATFDQERIFGETIRVECTTVEHSLQAPEVNLLLLENEYFEDFPGATLFDRICAGVHSYGETVQVLEPIRLPIGEFPAVLQEAQDSWAWSGRSAKVHFLHGGCQIDGKHILLLKAFCEKEHLEEFRPKILAIWESLTVFGDPGSALEKQQATLDKLYPSLVEENTPKIEIESFEVPKNDEDIFQLNGFSLSFHESTKFEINDYGGSLSIQLTAHLEQGIPDREELLDEYQSDGIVGFRLSLSGIHQRGIPTGCFDFEFGESQNRNADFSGQGWEYPLEFSGRVELRDGWVGMYGFLSGEYVDDSKHEIRLAKKIHLSTLDWSLYRFKSLLETEGIEPTKVCLLDLTNPEFETLPQRITSMINLKDLSISKVADWTDKSKLPLKEISEDFGRLTELNTLHLSGLSLRSLPNSLASLTKLEGVSVNQCLLEDTPLGLWSLPKLRYLYLSGNQLRSIPSQIQLPSLENLNLEKNSLETLPEELGQQAKLRVLELGQNSLTHLPDIFNSIEDIRMPIEDKRRLLDFEYKGADGKGIVPWSEVHFHFDKAHALVKEMHRNFRELGHQRHTEALTTLAKKTLVFRQQKDEDYSQVGNSRFGGWPDLPKAHSYPRYPNQEEDGPDTYAYDFIAQIDCAEVADFQGYLPRTGTLYFFLDSVHNLGAKVFHWEGPRDALVSGKGTDLSSEDFYDSIDVPYRGFQVDFKTELTLPYFYSAHSNSYLFEGDTSSISQDEDFLENIDEQLEFRDRSDFHEMNGYVFTQHESPELQAALKFKGRPQDWIVLLKVSSIGDFCWWDSGDLFFVIHKSDLARGDFSRIHCSLESS